MIKDDSMMPTQTYQGNKQAPCWDGYVQRGMKPGKDGRMVPNCVPAKKYIVDQLRPLF